ARSAPPDEGCSASFLNHARKSFRRTAATFVHQQNDTPAIRLCSATRRNHYCARAFKFALEIKHIIARISRQLSRLDLLNRLRLEPRESSTGHEVTDRTFPCEEIIAEPHCRAQCAAGIAAHVNDQRG